MNDRLLKKSSFISLMTAPGHGAVSLTKNYQKRRNTVPRSNSAWIVEETLNLFNFDRLQQSQVLFIDFDQQIPAALIINLLFYDFTEFE